MFQFPASPTIGQVFTPLPGLSYTWNGKGWAPPSFSTATTPMLFADGTLAAPGISWANEPNAGFRRVSTGTFQSVVGGNWIYGWNATGFTLNTGVGFYAGAATFSGTVTGITKAMVGLGNVLDYKQVQSTYGGAIYIGWDGAGLVSQVDGTGYGRNWPIDVQGAAARIRQGGGTNSTQMSFHWSGQGGQPSWLWGGNDGVNMYVYNPSNFSVNYANTCGTANNSNAVGGISGWNWHNRGKNPVHIWVNDGATNDQYLTTPGNLYVWQAERLQGREQYYFLRADTWNTCGGVNGNNLDYTLMRNDGNSHIWLAQSFDHTAFRNRVFHDGSSWIYQVGGDNGYHQLNCTSYSDEQLKHNIADTTVDATSAIKAMRFIKFNWNYGGKEIDIGFSAQNLRSIHPEFTKTVEQPPRPKPEDLPPDAPPLPDPDPFEGLSEVLTINPDAILVYVTKAMQEVLTRLDKLEAK